MLQCKMKCSMACLADPIRLNTIDRICAGTDTDSNRCPSHVAIVRGSADNIPFSCHLLWDHWLKLSQHWSSCKIQKNPQQTASSLRIMENIWHLHQLTKSILNKQRVFFMQFPFPILMQILVMVIKDIFIRANSFLT